MSDIKYTKDGKKVNVVGKLNNADYIVQEIFVTDDGAEIPAGENFVVSSLLDEPVKSWKEKNLEKLEEKYDKDRKSWEKAIEVQNHDMRLKHDSIKEQCKAASALLRSSEDDLSDRLLDAFEQMADFVSGNITHLFIENYHPEVRRFEDVVIDEDRDFGRVRVDGLKLVSLFGMTDGSLQWQINRYRDGSGDWSPVYPCRSYDEALELAQNRLDTIADEYVAGERRHLNLDEWRKIEGIKIPKDAEQTQKQEKAERLRKSVEQKKADLEKTVQELQEISEGDES